MLLITEDANLKLPISSGTGPSLSHHVLCNVNTGHVEPTTLPESDLKFSFNKMTFAASTIQNFYLRRTTSRKKTIEAIQCWIDEVKKKNVNHSDEIKK